MILKDWEVNHVKWEADMNIQIGFNKMAWNNTFKAFYLVMTLEPRTFKLYGGNQGEELMKLGHEKVKPLHLAKNLGKIFSALLVD